jgi:hypothetical protein
MSDVCVQLHVDMEKQLLDFCALMTKIGCLPTAVSTLNNKFLVWIENSPLLQTHFLTMPQGVTCGGYIVTIQEHCPKGRLVKVLPRASYHDVLEYVSKHEKEVSAWSPPTCLLAQKRLYYAKPTPPKKN